MLHTSLGAHWDMAIAGLSSALTSPHTTCFQTLPDHWAVQTQLKQNSHNPGDNLLAGGAFESEAAMASWGHRQEKIPDINSGAELYEASPGNFCLRLLARPERGKDPPEFIARSPVTMTSAPVNVQAGQIVEITGRVRVPYKIHGSLDGAMIFDSIGGKASALRWNKTEGWERFRFLREIPYDGAFTLKFVLDGLGSMQIDDVQVRSHGFVHLPHTIGPDIPGPVHRLQLAPDAISAGPIPQTIKRASPRYEPLAEPPTTDNDLPRPRIFDRSTDANVPDIENGPVIRPGNIRGPAVPGT